MAKAKNSLNKSESAKKKPKLEGPKIEFSFFATIDRINWADGTFSLCPAHDYQILEGGDGDRESEKVVYLFDIESEGIKTAGLDKFHFYAKLPYGNLRADNLPLSRIKATSKDVKEIPPVSFLAAYNPLLFAKLKFHVQGEMVTGNGRAGVGKIVVKRVLWVKRA